jgi:hypothetical protein
MVVGNLPIANKIAVVTGGGSGINLAFVKQALGEYRSPPTPKPT